jgi:hypothetical protein
VLAKRLQKPIFRERWSKQHALAEIAAHHNQSLKISNRIDTFGYNNAAETVSKINCRLTYRSIGDVGGAVFDKQSVQFEFGERKIPKAGE